MSNIKIMLSCDDNPFYYEFWNDVSYIWKNIFLFDPILFYISNEENKNLSEEYGRVIRVDKLKNIPVYLQAQLARVYFSKQFQEDICLISDIDMMPVSKKFFDKNKIANNTKENSFFHLNPTKREFGQLPMCYYTGYGRTFDKLSTNKTWEEFLEYVVSKDFNAEKLGFMLPNNLKDKKLWFSDELFLFSEINKLNIHIEKNNEIIKDNQRLDREMLLSYKGNISEAFIDCHMPRPYSIHNKHINFLTFKLENNE